eukprot:Polyplicarium_translucidae@DN2820_c0_g1_i1.p1
MLTVTCTLRVTWTSTLSGSFHLRQFPRRWRERDACCGRAGSRAVWQTSNFKATRTRRPHVRPVPHCGGIHGRRQRSDGSARVRHRTVPQRLLVESGSYGSQRDTRNSPTGGPTTSTSNTDGVVHIVVQMEGDPASGLDATHLSYAYSDIWQLSSFKRMDGTTISTPMRLYTEGDDWMDLVYNFTQYETSPYHNPTAVAKLPSGEVLGFVGSAEPSRPEGPTLVAVKYVDGSWQVVDSSRFPKQARYHVLGSEPRNENYVYYDVNGIPTMIGEQGIYKFTDENDVHFHRLEWSQLNVEPQFFRRTDSMLALAWEKNGEPRPLTLILVEPCDTDCPTTEAPTTTEALTTTTEELTTTTEELTTTTTEELTTTTTTEPPTTTTTEP